MELSITCELINIIIIVKWPKVGKCVGTIKVTASLAPVVAVLMNKPCEDPMVTKTCAIELQFVLG